MDAEKVNGNIDAAAPVHSTRIRVGRSIDGFGLSPGITKEQRLGGETLMKSAFGKLTGELAGKYYPLLGMDEADRLKLVDDHFLFISGDKNLIAAGMERDWPEGRGIFHNTAKTFLTWVNEEDQLRIISMQKGGESGGQTGITYDISNKHRLGYSEVELVQCMIDGVNTLVKENRELQKKHGIA